MSRPIFSLEADFCFVMKWKEKYFMALTYSAEESPPWETESLSAVQEILHISWNPKFHYLVHKSLSQDPIQSKLKPVDNHTSYFLFLSHLHLPVGLFLLGIGTKIFYEFFIPRVLHAPPISSSLVWSP
jgi:hypothetical protein